jgi:hypothetical protein
MYSDELEKRELDLEQIFLDPNNPRFWSEGERKTSEKKIPEETIQTKTQNKIDNFGVKELRESILRNGFLPMDRIVVRPIDGHGNKYVVVEGNRRLAALKSLYYQIEAGEIDEDGIDDEYLEKLKDSTKQIEVLLYKGTEGDISWALQGIRHISGIKEWSAAQRATLVAKQVDILKSGDNTAVFARVGQQFGLGRKAVARLYRVHNALQQMRDDDEYGDKCQDDHFTLFDEAYRNAGVRKWLKWDEEKQIFTDPTNLKQFYSWIIPDEENEDKRRIHNPDHVKILARLIENKRTSLIGAIDRYEMTIEEAKGNINATQGNNNNWSAEIDAATKIVKTLPVEIITDQPDELKTALLELRDYVDKTLSLLEGKSKT